MVSADSSGSDQISWICRLTELCCSPVSLVPILSRLPQAWWDIGIWFSIHSCFPLLEINFFAGMFVLLLPFLYQVASTCYLV